MIVYRGAKNKTLKQFGIWVTDDKEFAKEYGKVTRYLIRDNINLLDANTEIANLLANKFLKNPENNDSFATDIWYEPPIEFIKFLINKGYNGFINDKNILICRRAELKEG